jgi:hypothetical protein
MRYLLSGKRDAKTDNLINSAAHAAMMLARAEATRHKVTQACLVPSSSDPACKCNAVVAAQNEATARVSKAGKMLDDVLIAWSAKMARGKRIAAKKKA